MASALLKGITPSPCPLPLQGGEGNKDYPTARSSVFINLCSLQFATVVDVHRLPFRKDIEHLQSSFTVAVAGVLCTAERYMHLSADGAMVDVDDAGDDLVDRAHGCVHV